MPSNYVHPRRSGVHRVACISLYRALLSKCPKIEVPEHLKRGKIHPVAEVVRKQFKRNFRFESPMLVVGALKVGYEAEELLHNVLEGDAEALNKMVTLLEGYQAQSNATRAINLAHPPPPKVPHIVPKPRTGAHKILEDYPLPLSAITSGKRKVPSLATANGFPMLIYRKPQSPYLSRIIRDGISLRLKRQRVIGKLEEGMRFDSVAAMENEWDRRVGEQVGGKPPGKGKKVGWKQAYEESLWLQKQKVREESQKVKEMSARMTEIYLEEKKLAKEEEDVRRSERQMMRRVERKDRKDKEFLDTLSLDDREATIEKMRQDETKTAEHAYLYSLSPGDREEAVVKLRRDRKRKAEEKEKEGACLTPKDNIEEWWSETANNKNHAERTQSKDVDKYPLMPQKIVGEKREVAKKESNAESTQSRDVDDCPLERNVTVEEGRKVADEKNNAERQKPRNLDKKPPQAQDNMARARKAHRRQKDDAKVVPLGGNHKRAFRSWKPNGGS